MEKTSKKVELDLRINHVEEYEGQKFKVVEDTGCLLPCRGCAANKRGLEKVCYMLQCVANCRRDNKYVRWEIVD